MLGGTWQGLNQSSAHTQRIMHFPLQRLCSIVRSVRCMLYISRLISPRRRVLAIAWDQLQYLGFS